MNSRVNLVHIIDHFESLLFIHELLIDSFTFIVDAIDRFDHMVLDSVRLVVSVRARARVLIEVLHQLHFTVES